MSDRASTTSLKAPEHVNGPSGSEGDVTGLEAALDALSLGSSAFAKPSSLPAAPAPDASVLPGETKATTSIVDEKGAAEVAPASGVVASRDDDDTFVVEDYAEDMKPLRPYQARMVHRLKRSMDKFWSPASGTAASPVDAVLAYLPTGGGKTRIASEVIRSAVLARRRCVFIVNRNKLASQALDALRNAGLFSCTAVFKAGYEECLERPVQITSIQSLRTETRDFPPADVVVIDEAHCAVSDSFLELCRHYKSTGGFIIGLTATPLRLDPTESLSAVFRKMIRGPSITELVAQHVIAPPVVHTISQKVVRSKLKAQLGRVSKSSIPGDGAPQTLKQMICSDDMVREAVRSWRGLCNGAKTICFCVDIAHSKAVAAAFSRKGIPAAHIDGATSEKERSKIYKGFSAGAITVLTSVNVLCEGFDEPDIGAVMLLRPTRSKGMYIQMVGRGLRCFPGKRHCIVLDQSGNTMLHGPITGPYGYVPEPWGDDEENDGDVTALARKRAGKKQQLWRLRECGGGCGAQLHSGLDLCPRCEDAKYSSSPSASSAATTDKPPRRGLKDVTSSKTINSIGGAVAVKPKVKAKAAGSEEAAVVVGSEDAGSKRESGGYKGNEVTATGGSEGGGDDECDFMLIPRRVIKS